MNYPQNPFLQLTIPRVAGALERLKGSIWTEEQPLELSFAAGTGEPISYEQAITQRFDPVTLPFHWGDLFDQSWFKIELPAISAKKPLYLHWEEQGESTLHLKGLPFYGFDVAHKFCPLPAGKKQTAYLEGMCLQSAIWHPNATGLAKDGSVVSKVALYSRHELAWEVYHDLNVLFDICQEEGKAVNGGEYPSTSGSGFHPPISEVPVLYRRLLRILDDAVNALDRDGLQGMRKVLKAGYKSLAGQHERISCVLTGHAHIDLVWLWPERSSEYKAVHTFSSMNRLMDHYPEFIFGYSQPASYDAVERNAPQLMKEVKKRIGQGKWEPVGATEVESDTLMACGEALARSFIYGQRGYERLQGKPSEVLWIPDVFGYCGSLPQIMKQTGVAYFFTTKLTWSNINNFPYSSFVWRGIDGSEVVVHVTQGNGYNQEVKISEVQKGAEAYRQSDVHDEFLAPTGYGDGGGGVTEEMCERARRIQSIAGMPETKWGRIDTFFEKLNQQREMLPVWQGELYLEYHRGVLTTHGDLKEAFRKSERALQVWEAARVVLGQGEIDEQPWKRVVFAQFHDYIPGSSIWEVYEEGIPELQAIARDAMQTAATELSDGDSPAWFNPLPQPKRVSLPQGKGVAILPPLSGVAVKELTPIPSIEGLKSSATQLANDAVKMRFDNKGRIRKLEISGESIPVKTRLNDLVLYPDHAHMFEAWDIDRQTLSLGKSESSLATAVVEERAVNFTRSLGEKSSVTIRYELDETLPVVHISYDIDWQEENVLLKAAFVTDYAGTLTRYGAPFGSVLRSQIPGRMRDEAMFESAASRWVVLSDDAAATGLAVMTEAKYGFSCRDGALGVSLLRSAKVTGEDRNHRKLFEVDNRKGGKRAICSDIGKHHIKIAVSLSEVGQARVMQPAALAESLFTPALAYQGEAKESGFLGLDGGESLQAVWAKPAKDGKGWILRLNETMGQRGKTKIELAEGYVATPTDLMEGEGGKAITTLPFKPYDLLSVRIQKS
ncbi:glycoside hydrolase family 38 C-terminal domain-containing protein [Kiritimatiellota bacterium B12222]|nr:glycoside hydrolase family 38 C-terminal domain-containing protein [Kiritimatiellota bacterium B12222]